MINVKLNAYDEVQYISYPYADSQPENLKTLGSLFGMNPPDIKTSKVLELGCAEGNNLIPHALRYPKAKFVGVDLSKVQIEAGNKHVKSLGLKNLELKNCSITDIDEKFGKFDYIIAHGVISWVPDSVQEKIFEVSSKNLTENGIAYISYNTLPGWNTVRTIREMMLYHAKNFSTPQERINQARLLLNFIKDSLEGNNSPYANILRQESELLSKQSDNYLNHDHLEDMNKQFYFHEFMDHAQKHDLQYVADVSLPSMYVGNMPEKATKQLAGLNDIVRTEQYMDFITNRRFRSTLLCHKNIKLNRNINNEDIKKFGLSSHIIPEKPFEGVDLNNDDELTFFLKDKNSNIKTKSSSLKSVLYVLSQNLDNYLSFDEIVKKANKNLKANMKAEIERELMSNAMALIIKGYARISTELGNKDKIDTKKPKLADIVFYQATKTENNWVTNTIHKMVLINAFDKFVMQYMDGSRTKNQIIDCLVEDIKGGKITLTKEKSNLEDEKVIKEELEKFYDDAVLRFKNSLLFV